MFFAFVCTDDSSLVNSYLYSMKIALVYVVIIYASSFQIHVFDGQTML